MQYESKDIILATGHGYIRLMFLYLKAGWKMISEG